MTFSRVADHPIEPIFLERTSPRSFTGEAIAPSALMSMLEAARWAPSSSNVQPWRFIYAMRDTPQWPPIFDVLVPANQRWAAQAAALVVFLSDLHMQRGGQRLVSSWHAFDTGAAWLSFALQAHRMGWATHAMGGFLPDKARADLQVPDDFAIDAVVAVGRQAPADALPDDLKARELPSSRRALADSLFHGVYGAA